MVEVESLLRPESNLCSIYFKSLALMLGCFVLPVVEQIAVKFNINILYRPVWVG